jgi:hypothetical protein
MRIEENAPFTILAVQALMPELGNTPRTDLVSVGDVLCTGPMLTYADVC